MAITRRTAHFGLLATLAERHLAELGYQVEPAVIDAALNRQCESVGALLGISARAALPHAADSSALSLAEDIATVLRAADEGRDHL